jgi:aspartate/methionine/tyrosine aminotransferase
VKKYPEIIVVADEIYEHINFSGTLALHLSQRMRKKNTET